MNRYARQMQLPELGQSGQDRLAAARVLVVGCGGLAAPLLPLLAGAGVGHLTLVDDDRVAHSNLHRQTLFTEGDCGQPKAEIAAARCHALNSEITVETRLQILTPANAPGLVAAADLVLDCADSYAVSYTLSDVCLAHDIPLISASVLGFGGYVCGFCGGAPSLRAVFPDAPQNGASCESAGVIGPAVGIIGALMAQMALAHLIGLGPSPLGQMVQFDGRALRSSSFRFDRAPEPTAPIPFIAASQLTDADHVIELRQGADPLHPAARHVAADQLAEHLRTADACPDTRLVLCCATGLRAWRAAEDIKDIWPGEIALVAASAS